MRWAEQNSVPGQERRKFLSEARAAPPLMFGTMVNSSTVTFDSSTCSSSSRIVSGGLKFHCWRTISRNDVPPSGDHRRTNSCVRQFRALQKQGKCASAFVADRRPIEWFGCPTLPHASPALLRKRRQTPPENHRLPM